MDDTLSYIAAFIDDEKIYLSAADFNGLFRIDRNTNKSVYIGSFEKEDLWRDYIHRKAFVRGDKILFFPVLGSGITTFFPETGEMIYEGLPSSRKQRVFADVIPMNDGFLMVPRFFEDSFLYYSEREGIIAADEITDAIQNKYGKNNTVFCDFYSVVYAKDKLYIALCEKDIILEIDLAQYNIREIKLPDTYLKNMILLDGYLWVTPSVLDDCKNSVIRVDPYTGKKRRYPVEGLCDDDSFGLFSCYGNTLLMNSEHSDLLWIYEKEKDAWSIYDIEYPHPFHRCKDGLLFEGFYSYNDKLLLLPSAGNGILELDPKTDSVRFLASEIPSDFKKARIEIERKRKISVVKEKITQNEILHENKDIGFDVYLLSCNPRRQFVRRDACL